MGTNLRELLNKELPPAIPRIWPWLDSGESCLLWGGTGTGKSYLAMTLALGAAGGGEVLGWKFPNPCKTVYVDGEQSMRDLQTRFRVLGSAIEGHDAEKSQDRLCVLARTESSPGEVFFDLNAEDQFKAFIERLKESEVGFVVFDNLSTLTDTLTDENKSAEFKRMQALFAHLKAENIASILVHHAGKSLGSGYRGSSNIGTTFERIVGLFHNDKEPPTVLAVKAEIQKYRAKPPPGFSPQIHFRLQSVEDERGQPKSAVWLVDKEQGELSEGWRMFRMGEFECVAEFVKAYNERFGAVMKPSNFARDFSRRWQRDLSIPEAEIERVKGWMRSGKADGEPLDF